MMACFMLSIVSSFPLGPPAVFSAVTDIIPHLSIE